ncbi:MAG: hypothetical protein ABFS42_05080 [Candidatus Krumholzibacteriota bacterium]
MIDREGRPFLGLGFLTRSLLAAAFMAVILVPAAGAQEEPEPQDPPTVSQTAPQPAPSPRPGPDPGPFGKGRVRIGFYGGAGSAGGQSYVILGGGAGYYLVNGLEAGVDLEGWVFQSPSIWKVTPQLRYILWQMQPIHPYAGVFWRKTYVGGNWPDYDSWGARGGIAYRKGGNYLAVGLVYEKFENNLFDQDNYTIYPEIAFWISF